MSVQYCRVSYSIRFRLADELEETLEAREDFLEREVKQRTQEVDRMRTLLSTNPFTLPMCTGLMFESFEF